MFFFGTQCIYDLATVYFCNSIFCMVVYANCTSLCFTVLHCICMCIKIGLRRFLLCNVMHSADYAVSRCLSVHLSCAGRLLYQNVSSKIFHRRVVTPCQFFVLNVTTVFQREPLTALTAGGYKKITILDKYLALSQKQYKIIIIRQGHR